MAIPGDHKGRLPVVYRVSIGEVISRGDKTFPQKLDHFKIKMRSPEGGKRSWITYEEGQKMIEEGFVDWQGRPWEGYGPKPQRCPIVLFSDRPEDSLVSGVAWYGRNRRYCWATDFQGLDWEEEWAPAQCQIQRYGKPANMAEKDWQIIAAYHHAKEHVCKPATCPNYNSETAAYKCKRFAVLRFILPFAPTVTGVAEFRTTGKASCIALENSLRRFQGELNGMVAGVPLLLVMQPVQVETPDGKAQTAWEVRLDYPTDVSHFRALAAGAMERRSLDEGKLQAIAASYRALPAWTGEGRDEVVDHSREFAPEAADLPEVDPMERFDGLAKALEWLPGQKAAVLMKFEGDLEAAADFAQDAYDQQVKEEPAPILGAQEEPEAAADPQPQAEAEPDPEPDPEPEAAPEPEPERDEQGLSPEDYQPPEDEFPSGEPTSAAADPEWRAPICGKCGVTVSDKMMDDFNSGRLAQVLGREITEPLCASCANEEARAKKGVAV